MLHDDIHVIMWNCQKCLLALAENYGHQMGKKKHFGQGLPVSQLSTKKRICDAGHQKPARKLGGLWATHRKSANGQLERSSLLVLRHIFAPQKFSLSEAWVRFQMSWKKWRHSTITREHRRWKIKRRGAPNNINMYLVFLQHVMLWTCSFSTRTVWTK